MLFKKGAFGPGGGTRGWQRDPGTGARLGFAAQSPAHDFFHRQACIELEQAAARMVLLLVLAAVALPLRGTIPRALLVRAEPRQATAN